MGITCVKGGPQPFSQMRTLSDVRAAGMSVPCPFLPLDAGGSTRSEGLSPHTQTAPGLAPPGLGFSRRVVSSRQSPYYFF